MAACAALCLHRQQVPAGRGDPSEGHGSMKYSRDCRMADDSNIAFLNGCVYRQNIYITSHSTHTTNNAGHQCSWRPHIAIGKPNDQLFIQYQFPQNLLNLNDLQLQHNRNNYYLHEALFVRSIYLFMTYAYLMTLSIAQIITSIDDYWIMNIKNVVAQFKVRILPRHFLTTAEENDKNHQSR
jgi:hypothetical protein